MPEENNSYPAGFGRWLIAIAVMLSTFMEVLDTTVVNVSLPHIAGSLSATVDEATWTLTSYLVSNAIILPLTGWLSNFFGRKRMLIISVVGFTLGSFFCGLAPTLPFLIVFRVIQGACGGGLQPISQAILLETFPPEERGKAMGFWGLGIVVAPMLGPVLGGYLTDTFSWRWVFYINVPIGILAVIMTKIFVFDPQYIRRRSARVDYWGIGMLAIGIACLQVVLDKGQEKDWFSSRFITILAVVSAIALIAFIVYELRTDDPVVDLRVFKNVTYSTGVFLMAVLGVGLYGSLVVIPLVLQTLLGYPPLQAGIAMAPRGLGSFLAMPVVGLILAKVDARKLLGLGIIISAGTLIQLSFLNLNAGFWNFFWPQFYMGLALGMLFVPLTTITMDPIPNESMGNATSLFNLVRNVGGSIGIAAVTTIQTRRQQADIDILGSKVTAGNLSTRHLLNLFHGLFSSQGIGPKESMKMAYATLFQMVERQASIISYDTTFRLLGILFLGMIPFLILMKRPAKKSGPAAMH
ncbi:MAG TPA: DHA2 family efflux MFS transporter permease subunit [Candidatus Acidoferrales bacterium]|jgi:DHA2 family multidrug resistance protein|nr:DHA2 family efflux MFS transporter permease subunit [Candidatus Acidoferrales bacterium]